MSTDTKMFRGWPAEALEFYEGLEADNSKAYWTAHKDVYETVVLSPRGGGGGGGGGGGEEGGAVEAMFEVSHV